MSNDTLQQWDCRYACPGNLCTAVERIEVNQIETSHQPEERSIVERFEAPAKRVREYLSNLTPSLERGIESGALAAILGGAGLLSGARALLDGEHGRGIARVALGVGFITAALEQRRRHSHDEGSTVEQLDGEENESVIDVIADEAGIGENEVAVGEESEDETAVESDTGPDTIGRDTAERDEGEDGETVADADTETVEIDRLGRAAFDEQSREVPAPQRAFNQGFLAHSTETNWGIRARDDAVVVSLDFDAIQQREGMRYVASSEIGRGVRELPIPEPVLTHWDTVFGGGTAVVGGDDILFVTTEELATDGLLRVLPAEWDDELQD